MDQDYFKKFRKNIIGIDQTFESPFGEQKIIYADWTASGRMYKPIEDVFMKKIYPFVANTHTETTMTGCSMTQAYHKAKEIIKKHVNANSSDVLISSNSGMTGVVNKFQRILGLRLHERFHGHWKPEENKRPVIFITHMEHHSNQTSWIETIAKVEIIKANEDGLPDLNHLKHLLAKYKNSDFKAAAVTSCSNVTGVKTPYYEIAKMMHREGGLCFVDFACSAPYIDIDMHPSDPEASLDAVYFSPHKFLGGPGSSGILIFHPKLYKNKVPDNPGGGTVDWTNPWGEHKYFDEIEAREDGGTPSFLQTIRVALCIQLKEEMGAENILTREEEMVQTIFEYLEKIPNIHILAGNLKKRLGVISFYIEDMHYNLGVKILNDRFGIQVRGGCSCAGTYGHYLLQVSPEISKNITDRISIGDNTLKPGWIRMSIHPTMTNEELYTCLEGIKLLALHHQEWVEDYDYNPRKNEFSYRYGTFDPQEMVNHWFDTKKTIV